VFQQREAAEDEDGRLRVEVPFCSHNQHQSVRTATKYFASLERRKKVNSVMNQMDRFHCFSRKD
jgi:hypothetical protein